MNTIKISRAKSGQHYELYVRERNRALISIAGGALVCAAAFTFGALDLRAAPLGASALLAVGIGVSAYTVRYIVLLHHFLRDVGER